jgi:hypothetical protein
VDAAGTNHFATPATRPTRRSPNADEERYGGLMDQVGARLAELAPPDADPGEVARVIVRCRRIGLDDLLRSRRALQA